MSMERNEAPRLAINRIKAVSSSRCCDSFLCCITLGVYKCCARDWRESLSTRESQIISEILTELYKLYEESNVEIQIRSTKTTLKTYTDMNQRNRAEYP